MSPLPEPADQTAERRAIENRRRLAQSLQNAQRPEGRMVGRFYVAPSPFEHAASLSSQLLGAYQHRKANQQEDELEKRMGLADALRRRQIEDSNESMIRALTDDPRPSRVDMTGKPIPGTEVPGILDPDTGRTSLSTRGEQLNQAVSGMEGSQANNLLRGFALQKILPPAPEEYTLSSGQGRFRGNQQIASLPAAPESTIGKLDPSRYTPSSVAKYRESGNYADLEAVPDRQDAGAPLLRSSNGITFQSLDNGRTWSPIADPNQIAAMVAQITAGRTAGAATGEKQAGLEASLNTLGEFRTNVQKLLDHPGFNAIYGVSSVADPRNYVRGTPARGAEALRNQLGSRAFLASIQAMRGFGQLSNMEGAKVETALTRALQPSLGDREAKAAFDDLSRTLDNLERVARAEAAAVPTALQTPNLSPADVPTQGLPAAEPSGLPATNAQGWELMVDANGNRAYVSPDGTQFEEVR